MINIELLNLLDKCGLYKTADIYQARLIKLSAWPYNLVALDELPLSARNTLWDKNVEDYNQYDDLFWKELKQRLPDYRQLKTDKSEVDNMEGEMHGPDPTPGPAFVWPETGATSPSMTGDLDYFSWDQAHDANKGVDEWKNLQPRR